MQIREDEKHLEHLGVAKSVKLRTIVAGSRDGVVIEDVRKAMTCLS